MRTAGRFAAALVSAWLIPTARVDAHALSVSYAQFSVHDRTIDAVVRLPLDDVDLLLRLDRDLDGRVSDAELAGSRTALADYFQRHLHVQAGGTVESSLERVTTWRDPTNAQYLEADLSIRAPREIETISIRSDFLVDLYPAHKTLADIRLPGRNEQFVFEPGRVYQARLRSASAWTTARSFLRLGIEHILTGYDHILFLFGLLLIGTGLRNLIAIVTSFTVAHSATLAAATLGVVTPVPWMVEAAIALSIAYIGIENLFVHAPRDRWRIAFLFGLVHGFGFAAVLRDMHLPRASMAASLVSFNLGVEAGQIAIVTLMFPLLMLLAGTRHHLAVVRAASAAITAVALVWFYQRIP